jgi:hypothetical protein
MTPVDGSTRGLFDLVRQLARAHPEGITPQQVRDIVKAQYPAYYGTESHRRNVERGHYQSLDHALLAQVYVAAQKAAGVMADRSTKPMKIFPLADTIDEAVVAEGVIDTENLDKLEAGVGTMYVLGTHLYTKDGREIIKIGVTTGSVEARINQLYTTGVPFRFRIIKTVETKNYDRLETALHSMLDPFRINRSREFFTDHCLEHLETIITIHHDIQRNAGE